MTRIEDLSNYKLKHYSYQLFRKGIRFVHISKHGNKLIAKRRIGRHTDTVHVIEAGGIFYAKTNNPDETSIETSVLSALLSTFTQINSDHIFAVA